MQAAHRGSGLGAVDHHGQADGRRGDGQDVDVVLAEGLERLGGDAGAGLHARAHDADLGDVLVDHVFARVDVGKDALHRLAGALLVGARAGEADVGDAVLGHVLDDHVHAHLVARQGAEQLGGDAGHVGHAADGDLHFRRVVCDAGDDGFLHHVGFLLDIGALGVGERRAGMDDHVVLAGELDGAHLQDAGAGAGELQHVLVVDDVELLRARADARVGGVDAVHVGVDLAHVGVQAVRHSDRRGVGAAATERGDIAVGVNALEAGNDGDGAALERIAHALAVHHDDLRLVVELVGLNASLAAGEAHGLVAACLDGHGQKRHGHLLAGGKQTVHLAQRRVIVERGGQAHQLVGGLAHGGHHGDHVMAGLLLRDQLLRNHLDALGACNGRAPEFAYD